MKTSRNFKFIDLFSGIGGFHQAMTNLGGECVLASDIDKDCREVYEKNYGIKPLADIRLIDEKLIPDHDVLCAGFPCQPFSKGGFQNGFTDTTRGTLFYEIVRIIKAKKPRFLILENVDRLIKSPVSTPLHIQTNSSYKLDHLNKPKSGRFGICYL